MLPLKWYKLSIWLALIPLGTKAADLVGKCLMGLGLRDPHFYMILHLQDLI